MRALISLLPILGLVGLSTACTTTSEPDPPGRQIAIVHDVSASMQHGQIGPSRNGVQTFIDALDDDGKTDELAIELFGGEEYPAFTGLFDVDAHYDYLTERTADLDWCASLDAADRPMFPGGDECGSAPWRGVDNAVNLLSADGHNDYEAIILILGAAPDCSSQGCGPTETTLAKSETEWAIDQAWDRGINVWTISLYGPYASPTAWTNTLVRGDGTSMTGPAGDMGPFLTAIAGQLPD